MVRRRREQTDIDDLGIAMPNGIIDRFLRDTEEVGAQNSVRDFYIQSGCKFTLTTKISADCVC